MMARHLLAAMAAMAALAAAVLAGCSTYVNIPSQSADVARHDPNQKAVQEVEIAAIRAVLEDRPIQGRFQVVLPPGTDQLVYEMVAVNTDKDAMWSLEGARPDEHVIEARQIRVRGWFAQVDVIRPAVAAQPQGLKQLVTVYLQWDLVNGWYLRRLRAWRVPVEEALRLSAQDDTAEYK